MRICYQFTSQLSYYIPLYFILNGQSGKILLQFQQKYSMENRKKYQSIYQMVNLPNIRHLSNEEILFEKHEPNAQQKNYITADIARDRDRLIDRIQSESCVYTDVNYKFKFPASKFPDVAPGQKNNLSYQEKISVEDEDTFAKSLTPQQIAQIKQTGHFDVKSKLFGTAVPYVWKINGNIFKGVKRRAAIWLAGLGNIYKIMDFAVQFFIQIVPKSLLQLGKLPIKLFNLIFGKKRLQAIQNTNFNRQLHKDFWTDIMQNQLKDIKNEISHQFLELFYQYYQPAQYRQNNVNPNNYELQLQSSKDKIKQYQQKQTKINQLKSWLRNIQGSFQLNWAKIRKNVLNKLTNQIDQDHIVMHMSKSAIQDHQEDNKLGKKLKEQQKIDQTVYKDNRVLDRFYQEKYLLYTAHLKDNIQKDNKLSKNAVEALLNLVTIFHIITSKLRIKGQKLAEASTKIQSKIFKDHPIRSQSESFVNKMHNKQQSPIRQKINNQFFTNLQKDPKLSKILTPTYESIYRKYVTFLKSQPELLSLKQQSFPTLYQPQRIFRTTYILFPPYQTITQTNTYNNSVQYSLKKRQELKCDTSTHAWKCKLYWMRLRSWTINCFKFLIGACWAGPLGIRCLCGTQSFVYDQDINYTTGRKTQISRPTLLGVFGKVMRGIKKSRANFQAQPDRGLFGKNCARIFNLIQCYIFRFFIVGVIGVLMLYPVAIILFSAISFVGVLTCWIWVPLCMFLTYMFNILVFQFQVGLYNRGGCLIRSVPLLGLALNILYHVVRIVGATLFLLVLAPLACVLYFIWLVLQRVCRTISDTIMIGFIGCCGRTPSRDTSIARKVSGPGMSRNYFYSIAQNNVYILTQCALQKLVINKFIDLTRKQISANQNKSNNIFSFIFKPFGLTRPVYSSLNKDYISKNNTDLLTNFNNAANQYLARYPNYPRMVRFTQEQIQQYFTNAVKIVKNFIIKEKIQDWIFQEKRIIYEDYQELTRYLWIEIFQCGEEIFQPLEKIDSRFKLLDEQNPQNQMQQKVSSIMLALQGQVELTHKKITFTPAKKSLLDKDKYPFYYLSTICSYHDSNSRASINVNNDDPCCIFVAHRNLNQLKEYDQIQKEKSAKGKYCVIEEV